MRGVGFETGWAFVELGTRPWVGVVDVGGYECNWVDGWVFELAMGWVG